MTAIVTAACLAGLLSAGYILRVQGAGDTIAALPAPTEPVYPGRACSLPVLKGIHIDPRSLLSIGFVVDSCDERSLERYEVQRLIGYFLAGLTVPDEDLWVNLSPDEEDRVLADGMETTELGRDLLAQDYLLKQLASSLTHPDTPTGQAYWRVENGKSTIENRLGKIWIVPDKAEVYEQGTTVVITESSLKLQCEDEAQQVLLPTITKDVNEGKNFAKLRQIYHSLILARWFKTKLRDSLYAAYIDAHKLKGIDTCDPALKEKIFGLYIESFKKGVYDTIRSDSASDQFSILDSLFSKNRRRRFFSGGVSPMPAMLRSASSLTNFRFKGRGRVVSSSMEEIGKQTAVEYTAEDYRAFEYEYRHYIDEYGLREEYDEWHRLFPEGFGKWHCWRVGWYAFMIGRQLHRQGFVSGEGVRQLTIAALYHDFGGMEGSVDDVMAQNRSMRELLRLYDPSIPAEGRITDLMEEKMLAYTNGGVSREAAIEAMIDQTNARYVEVKGVELSPQLREMLYEEFDHAYNSMRRLGMLNKPVGEAAGLFIRRHMIGYDEPQRMETVSQRSGLPLAELQPLLLAVYCCDKLDAGTSADKTRARYGKYQSLEKTIAFYTDQRIKAGIADERIEPVMLRLLADEDDTYGMRAVMTLGRRMQAFPQEDMQWVQSQRQMQNSVFELFTDRDMLDPVVIAEERRAGPTIALDLNDTVAGYRVAENGSGVDDWEYLPRPGIERDLERLAGSGYRLVLWTGDERSHVQEFFRQHPNIARYFSRVFTAENFSVKMDSDGALDPVDEERLVGAYASVGMGERERIREYYRTHTDEEVKDAALYGYAALITNTRRRADVPVAELELPAGRFTEVRIPAYIALPPEIEAMLPPEKRNPEPFAGQVLNALGETGSSGLNGGIDFTGTVTVNGSSAIVPGGNAVGMSAEGLRVRIVKISDVRECDIIPPWNGKGLLN